MTALDLTTHRVASIGAVLSLSDGLAALTRNRARPIPVDDIRAVLAEYGLHVVLTSEPRTHVVILGEHHRVAALVGRQEADGLVEVVARSAPGWPAMTAELVPTQMVVELLERAREADLATNAAAIAEHASDQAAGRLVDLLGRACSDAPAGPSEPATEEIRLVAPLERAS